MERSSQANRITTGAPKKVGEFFLAMLPAPPRMMRGSNKPGWGAWAYICMSPLTMASFLYVLCKTAKML